MKGSSVLSENILEGMALVISLILMVMVVRLVLSEQNERSQNNVLDSVARDIAMIIDREAAMVGDGQKGYEFPKGLRCNVTIYHKLLVLSVPKKEVSKTFSGHVSFTPYNFIEPAELCFKKTAGKITVEEGTCGNP